MSKKATYRFSEEMDRWLEEQAIKRGTAKNDVLREPIYKSMLSEAANKPSEPNRCQ